MSRKNIGKAVCKIVSIIMLLIMLFSIVLFISTYTSGGGSGFLDLSNIVRYFLAGIAVASGIVFAITAKKGWNFNLL